MHTFRTLNYNQVIEQAVHEASQDVITQKQILDDAYFESRLAALKQYEAIQRTERDWIQDYINLLRVSLRKYVQSRNDKFVEATLENLTRYKPFNNQCPITFKNLAKKEGLALSTGRVYDPHAIAEWVYIQNKNTDPVSREPLTAGDRDRIAEYRPAIQPVIPAVRRPVASSNNSRLSKLLYRVGATLIIGASMIGTAILSLALGAGPILFFTSMFCIGPLLGCGILLGGIVIGNKIKNYINQRRQQALAQQRHEHEPELEINVINHHHSIEEKLAPQPPQITLPLLEDSDSALHNAQPMSPRVSSQTIVTNSLFQKRMEAKTEPDISIATKLSP